MSELTAKEQRFVDEYLVDLNGTQAAIRAGYSEDSAAVIAFDNLRKPNIARAVANRQLAIRQKLQISAEAVVRETARLAFADIRNVARFNDERGVQFLDDDELSDDAAATIAEVSSETTYRPGKRKDDEGMNVEKRRVKMHPKLPALELLAKLIGMTGPTAQTIGTQQNLVLPSGTSLDDLIKLRDELRGAVNGD